MELMNGFKFPALWQTQTENNKEKQALLRMSAAEIGVSDMCRMSPQGFFVVHVNEAHG